MKKHRTAGEIRRFDLFKLMVSIGLLAFIIFLVFYSRPFARFWPVYAADLAPTLNLPTDAGTNGPVALNGKAEPGQEVQILINGQVVGRANVGNDGQWSLTTEINEPGVYEVSVQTVDQSGVIVATSESTSLTVAVSPTMTATVVEAIVTNKGTDTVETAPTAEPTQAVETAPTAEPTQAVSTSVSVESTQAVETAPTAEPTQAVSTSVSVEPTQAVSTSVSVEPTQTVSTSVSVEPTQTAEITVSTETSPTIESTPTIEPTQTAPPSSVGGPVLNLPTKNLTVSGKGEPGLQVQILIDGQLVGNTSIGSNGEWVFTTEISQAGEHQVSMELLNQSGQIVGTSGPVSFFVTLPTSPSSDLVCESIYLVLADEWLTGIARRYWGNGFLYPAIVTATNQKHAVDDTFANITNPDFVKPGWKLCLVDEGTATQMIQ
ncbi:MAG: hypothetical protein ACPGWR_03000 [Ardenticatenaceae bacterium]